MQLRRPVSTQSDFQKYTILGHVSYESMEYGATPKWFRTLPSHDQKYCGYCYDLNFAVNRKGEKVLEHSRTGSRTPTSGTGRVNSAERRGTYIKVEQTPFYRFSTSSGQRLRPILCNRCWRTRGGGPNRLGNRPRGIPTDTSRRRKASFTRVIDPTLQRINFTALLGRRHPQGSHQRTGPHTGLSPAEEPESRSNSYLARKSRGEEGPRGLSEDTDGVIDQRRKKDSEDLPPARSSRDSSWISSPRPGVREVFV
ncbi:hypothetical protein GEV33_008730 [Tenebrio molitor]|uniref:Uncharacterized protein n=1 Tax=Tenebrio molitor TaxID=7067 RepID=A0A8J6H8K2_TENMO|nr:hypothetical protein GEV33_008730 [Tenebrio molitor]